MAECKVYRIKSGTGDKLTNRGIDQFGSNAAISGKLLSKLGKKCFNCN